MHVSLHASEKHSLPPRGVRGDMCAELSAGPGRGWRRTKGHGTHCTQGGPLGDRGGTGGPDRHPERQRRKYGGGGRDSKTEQKTKNQTKPTKKTEGKARGEVERHGLCRMMRLLEGCWGRLGPLAFVRLARAALWGWWQGDFSAGSCRNPPCPG